VVVNRRSLPFSTFIYVIVELIPFFSTLNQISNISEYICDSRVNSLLFDSTKSQIFQNIYEGRK
jgi:hypothetical protein